MFHRRQEYEIEASKSGWSVRTLQRQYNFSLVERLKARMNLQKRITKIISEYLG